ncbi:Response regulator of zinc sigma-54-dependent two-component system [hydrothermal vent metagenome]|uniref:Response regulator of zinc sigma-54-dependent two-component system n=1 Tax=hydrothermal vent metagenome TaxID=652676 RepID=A0A3B1CW64_9ZZZZ
MVRGYSGVQYLIAEVIIIYKRGFVMAEADRISILVVEDEQDMREFLRDILLEHGYAVETASNGHDALALMQRRRFQIVISDIKMPVMDGLSFLDRTRTGNGFSPFVILITAFGNIDDTVKLMDRGAYDYIIKPFKMEQILVAVKKAVRELEMRKRLRELEEMTAKRYSFHNLTGKSPAMIKIFTFIEKIVDSGGNVLIEGETGTGKEMIARAIHLCSQRKEKPFVPVNCASIPEGLLESELFGHVRGAFTDAKNDKKGLFLEAEAGTLLLDEITEMPVTLQPKLLRALQDRQVKPVGSNKYIPFDVRIISATNRNLMEEVRAGRFREDLYYRLNIFRIELPPLRQRREDIPILVQEFLNRYEQKEKKTRISPEVMRFLMDYPWPGNIRELENVIERSVYLSEDGVVRIKDMPDEMLATGSAEEGFRFTEEKSLDELQRQYIEHILERCGGNKKRAAEILGVNRKTIYRKLLEIRKE